MTSATKAQLDLWPVAFNPIIRVFDGNVLWEIRRRRIAGVIQKIFVIVGNRVIAFMSTGVGPRGKQQSVRGS
jgi:hypothetical protein